MMSPLPLVSVLVLAYNHGPYIEACLDGILQQDYQGPVEVLVGEDRSTDDTRAIVERLAQAHRGIVRVITSSENVGMHANNRRLLTASSGDLVAYCEGDDEWHARDKLSIQVEYLRSHLEHVGVHSDVDHLVQRGGTWYRLPDFWAHHLDRPTETTFTDLLSRNTIQTCAVMLRGDIARTYPQSPLAEGHYAVEDWPMFLMASLEAPFGLIRRSLATYRRVEGSVTNNGADAAERRLLDQLRLIDDAAQLVDRRAELEVARRKGLAATRRALVVNALTSRRKDLLLRALEDLAPYDVPRERASTVLEVMARAPGGLIAGRALAMAAHARSRVSYRRHHVPPSPDPYTG